MQDLSSENSSGNVWVTKYISDNILYEYSSMIDFRKDRLKKAYTLEYYFYGTGHAVFQGNFFYQRTGYAEIIKFSLKDNQASAKLCIERAAYSGDTFLYGTESSYFDLSVDENGIWMIYSNDSDTETITVSRLNHTNMSLMTSVNISVDRKQYSNGFVACGILYLIRDTRAKTTDIDYAYDLFNRQNLTISLKFINPFQMNNMVTYVPKTKQIFSWDRGNQLIYTLSVH